MAAVHAYTFGAKFKAQPRCAHHVWDGRTIGEVFRQLDCRITKFPFRNSEAFHPKAFPEFLAIFPLGYIWIFSVLSEGLHARIPQFIPSFSVGVKS